MRRAGAAAGGAHSACAQLGQRPAATGCTSCDWWAARPRRCMMRLIFGKPFIFAFMSPTFSPYCRVHTETCIV